MRRFGDAGAASNVKHGLSDMKICNASIGASAWAAEVVARFLVEIMMPAIENEE